MTSVVRWGKVGLAVIRYIVGLGARDQGAMEEGLFRPSFLQWSNSWLRTRISMTVFDFFIYLVFRIRNTWFHARAFVGQQGSF